MKNFFPLLFLIFSLCSCSSTIYLVRHAEKQTASSGNMSATDPDLTLDGRIRAKVLADTLTGKKIAGVFSTNYKRTIQTAEPTAIIKLTTVKKYTDGNKLMDSLAQRKNKGFLVVGHSNTIPQMLQHLGLNPSMNEIPENDYDNLFIITIKWLFRKSISLKETTYGKPSP